MRSSLALVKCMHLNVYVLIFRLKTLPHLFFIFIRYYHKNIFEHFAGLMNLMKKVKSKVYLSIFADVLSTVYNLLDHCFQMLRQ